MRIAYHSSFFPSLSTTFIYREVTALKKLGLDIRTYSLRRPDQKKISADALELYHGTSYLLPIRMGEVLSSHVKFLFRNPVRYFSALVKMTFATGLSIKNRWRGILHFIVGGVLAQRMIVDKIDHVHATFASHAASAVRVVHLLTGIPFSVAAHASDIWFDPVLLPQKLAEAKFFVCCSEFGSGHLRGLVKGSRSCPVHTIYHGINIHRFRPPESDCREKNLILSVGRLIPAKGFADLIRGVAILRDRGISVRCVLVGDGELRSELEALVQSLKLNEHVELAGAVPQERIIGYYHRASIFCLPCRPTDDGVMDNIPNVLLESMACGLPVISTVMAGRTELISDGVDGILLQTGSAQEVADSIAGLLIDDNRLRELSAAARRKVELTFDASKMILPLQQIFLRGVGGKLTSSAS